MSAPPQSLTAIEARLLGVLIEKEKTTPDVYPMTINSLLSGCNQKTSREPVMTLGEADIQAALDELRGRTLVIDTYGASGRVMRFAHNFRKVYGVPAASVALLATLMLRGPQTAAELRMNADRLYHFADTSSVEAFLEELAAWASGPMVVKLAKQPGSREHRWAHRLCGDVVPQVELPAANRTGSSDRGGLEERVARLEHELAELRAELRAALGAAAASDQASSE